MMDKNGLLARLCASCTSFASVPRATVAQPSTPQALVLGAAAAGLVMTGKLSFLEIHTSRVYNAQSFEGLGEYVYLVSSQAKLPTAQDKALDTALQTTTKQMTLPCSSRFVLGVVKLQRLCTQCNDKQLKLLRIGGAGKGSSCNKANFSCLFVVLGVWGIGQMKVSSPPGSVFERIYSLNPDEEAEAWQCIKEAKEWQCIHADSAQLTQGRKPEPSPLGFYTGDDAPRQLKDSNNCGVVILLHGGLVGANCPQENARKAIHDKLLEKQEDGYIGDIAVSEDSLVSLKPLKFLSSDVMDPALQVLQGMAPSITYLNGFFYERITSLLALALANNDQSMIVSHLKVGRAWLCKDGFELTKNSVVISVINHNLDHWIAVRLCFATCSVSVTCGLRRLELYKTEVTAVCRAMMALLYLEPSHAPVWLQAKIWGIIRHYHYYFYYYYYDYYYYYYYY
jgi:hypothetical protein